MPEDGGWLLLESQQARIAFDTNMLLYAEKFKLDLSAQAEEMFPNCKKAVPLQVLEELERLGKKAALKKQARIAEEILSKGFQSLRVEAENADKALLKLSAIGYIIATNDRALRKEIKSNSGKCLILRKKKRLFLE